MERYIEQTAVSEKNAGKRFAHILLIGGAILSLILAAVCAASAMPPSPDGKLNVNWLALLGIALFIALAALCWRSKDRLFVDYDYSFNEDALNISAVYNSRRRKQLGTLDLRSIRLCGSTDSAAYKKLIAQRQITCRKWYANPSQPLTFFMYEEGGKRECVILELNEAMIERIRRSNRLAPGTWNNQEGK